MYKLTQNPDVVINTDENTTIPLGHRLWAEYEDWLAEGNTPEAADIPIESQPKTQFTSLEFLDRFTQDEQLNVAQAAMTNAQLKLWYDRLLAASFVDLLDPRTEEGVDALIAAGLIAADRKLELMTP